MDNRRFSSLRALFPKANDHLTLGSSPSRSHDSKSSFVSYILKSINRDVREPLTQEIRRTKRAGNRLQLLTEELRDGRLLKSFNLRQMLGRQKTSVRKSSSSSKKKKKIQEESVSKRTVRKNSQEKKVRKNRTLREPCRQLRKHQGDVCYCQGPMTESPGNWQRLPMVHGRR